MFKQVEKKIVQKQGKEFIIAQCELRGAKILSKRTAYHLKPHYDNRYSLLQNLRTQ